MKKTALGRGLDALLPTADSSDLLLSLDILDIDTNPDQPRKDFDKQALAELADSIGRLGLLQPILVQRRGDRYTIIAGERRFRAARMAGLKEIPALVRDYEKEQADAAALIENLQRENLNPIEAAEGIRRLMDRHAMTQEKAAETLGKSRPAIANTLRLLGLEEQVKQWLREGLLSAGHARALVNISPASLQLKMAEKTIKEGLSVRTLEALIKQEQEKNKQIKPINERPLEFAEFEARMQEALGLKAHIAGDLKKGKITLPYTSREELEYLYSRIEALLE